MANVSLSQLDRAALSGRESYWWIHASAGLYCVIIGGFSVAAWTAAGEPFKAAMCAGAQLLAIVCAILGRRAFTGQMGISGIFAIAASAGCAWWAALGVQHAWQVNGEPISWEMVMFLAALEPGLFLLAEHIQEGREALRRAHARELDEQEEVLRQARDRQRRLDAEADERRRARDIAALPPAPAATVRQIADARTKRQTASRRAAAGIIAVAASAGLPAVAAAEQPLHLSTLAETASPSGMSMAAILAAGDQLYGEGRPVSWPALSEATGVPVSTLRRRLAAEQIVHTDRWPKPLAARAA